MTIAIKTSIGALIQVALISSAMAQQEIEITCPRVRMELASCDTTVGRPLPNDQIRLASKVTGSGYGPYNRKRITVDVVDASITNMPSQIDIEFDRCLEWKSPDGTEIEVYIWKRASPNNGAYTLADCPK